MPFAVFALILGPSLMVGLVTSLFSVLTIFTTFDTSRLDVGGGGKDPWTAFSGPLLNQASPDDTEEYTGVGLVFSGRPVTVTGVIPDSPAAAAGILVGDQLVSVDGMPFDELSAPEAANRIRGEVGTELVLVVRRLGLATDLVISLERAALRPRVRQPDIRGELHRYLTQDFDQPDARWQIHAGEQTVRYIDEELELSLDAGDRLWNVVSIPGIHLDVVLEVDARLIGETSGRRLSFSCRATTTARAPIDFVIEPDNNAYFLFRTTESGTDRIASGRSPAIRSGGASNRVELRCLGSRAEMLVNGVVVTAAMLGENEAYGQLAIGVAPGERPAAARFDNVVVTRVSPVPSSGPSCEAPGVETSPQTAEAGSTLTITAGGFAPFTSISAWVASGAFSSQRRDFRSSSFCRLLGQFELPESLPGGIYTIHADGTATNGSPLSLSAEFVVRPLPTATSTASPAVATTTPRPASTPSVRTLPPTTTPVPSVGTPFGQSLDRILHRIPPGAELSFVTFSRANCDYFIVNAPLGYSVLESFSGFPPATGDILAGETETYGFHSLYNATQDRSLRVWVDDYWLSSGGASELYLRRCNP